MTSKLHTLNLDASIAHNSEAFVAVLKTLKHDDPLRNGAIEAYVHGFRWVYLTLTMAAASALIASAFIKKFSMDKELASMYTAREVEVLPESGTGKGVGVGTVGEEKVGN